MCPKFLDTPICANSIDPGLKEQSDLDLHCLPFFLHLLEALLYGSNTLSQHEILVLIT